jgi:hypothetical protein
MLNYIEKTQRDKLYLQINSTTENDIINILNDENYNIQNDIDENGNNVLHYLVMNCWTDYYNIVKNHKNFDKIKNAKNNFGFTPKDEAKCFPFIITTAFFYFFGKNIDRCNIDSIMKENEIKNMKLFDDDDLKKILNEYKSKYLKFIDNVELEDKINLPAKELVKCYFDKNIISILQKSKMCVLLYQYDKTYLTNIFNYFIDTLEKNTIPEIADEIINYTFVKTYKKKLLKFEDSLKFSEDDCDDDNVCIQYHSDEENVGT